MRELGAAAAAAAACVRAARGFVRSGKVRERARRALVASLTFKARLEMPGRSSTAVAMVVPLALSTNARAQIGSWTPSGRPRNFHCAGRQQIDAQFRQGFFESKGQGAVFGCIRGPSHGDTREHGPRTKP